jgi:hypothetical protein
MARLYELRALKREPDGQRFRVVTTSTTLLKAGPAGGRLRRPSSAGRATISEPRFTHAR